MHLRQLMQSDAQGRPLPLAWDEVHLGEAGRRLTAEVVLRAIRDR